MNHVIVLAGGDGNRLSVPAIARYGYPRPKQFCDFGDGLTLLDRTLVRARKLASPEQIVVVTTQGHRREAQEVLAAWPGVRWLEQPKNRDTLPGIALAVFTILDRDPFARILILPSDHAVEDDATFGGCLARALHELDHHPFELLLLGAAVEHPEEGYGWIVPGLDDGGTFEVAAFVEKPPPAALEALQRRGALANTFVLAGQAWTFAELLWLHARRWFVAIQASLRDPRVLVRSHESLPSASFSTEVLEVARDRLRVLRIPEVGWSDVGTPDRLRRVYKSA